MQKASASRADAFFCYKGAPDTIRAAVLDVL